MGFYTYATLWMVWIYFMSCTVYRQQKSKHSLSFKSQSEASGWPVCIQSCTPVTLIRATLISSLQKPQRWRCVCEIIIETWRPVKRVSVCMLTLFVLCFLSLWFLCYTHLSSSDLWANAGSVLSARKHNDQLYHYKLYNIIVIQHRQLSDFKAEGPRWF